MSESFVTVYGDFDEQGRLSQLTVTLPHATPEQLDQIIRMVAAQARREPGIAATKVMVAPRPATPVNPAPDPLSADTDVNSLPPYQAWKAGVR